MRYDKSSLCLNHQADHPFSIVTTLVMKTRISTLLLIITGFGSHVFGQDEPRRQFFTICVGTFLNATLADFDNLRDIGFIYDEPSENALLKIHLGGYSTVEDATSTLGQVKSRGYQDAYIVSRPLDRDGKSLFIQLGLFNLESQTDWSKYLKAGQLFVLLDGNKNKIVAGPYSEKADADQNLSAIRNMGFSDAFIRSAPLAQVTKISGFETGGLIIEKSSNAPNKNLEDTTQITIDTKPASPSPQGVERSAETGLLLFSFQETSAVHSTTDSTSDNIPEKKQQTVSKKTPTPQESLQVNNLPKIRGNVSRQSVRDLQTALLKSGSYTSVVDGLYGPATEKAYREEFVNNRQFQKYRILTAHIPVTIESPGLSSLDNAILELDNDFDSAMNFFANEGSPVSKGFRAYAEYIENGPSMAVDDLMNGALKMSFEGKKISFPFDPSATYAYRSLDQLILHLSFIMKVYEPQPIVPCWLFKKHPKEAFDAFRSVKALPVPYRIEPCDPFLQWEPVKVLHTMVADLCPSRVLQKISSDVQVNAANRSKVAMTPAPVSPGDLDALYKWNTDLWEMLDRKADNDVLYAEKIEALKIEFQQCRVLLEDYFLDANLDTAEANSLALYVLHSLVNPYLTFLGEKSRPLQD